MTLIVDVVSSLPAVALHAVWPPLATAVSHQPPPWVKYYLSEASGAAMTLVLTLTRLPVAREDFDVVRETMLLCWAVSMLLEQLQATTANGVNAYTADFFAIGLALPSALLTTIVLVLNVWDQPSPMAGRELFCLAVLFHWLKLTRVATHNLTIGPLVLMCFRMIGAE